jgi:hypothetical protein
MSTMRESSSSSAKRWMVMLALWSWEGGGADGVDGVWEGCERARDEWRRKRVVRMLGGRIFESCCYIFVEEDGCIGVEEDKG